MNIEIITAPLIGGIIGLITNSLAIKMLFRPYKEKFIGKMHIPFTPGLIPKEKARIANAIGDVIASYILDSKTIMSALASNQIKEAYEKKYEKKLLEFKALNCTLEELLEQKKLIDTSNVIESKIRDSIGKYIVEVCIEEELSRNLVNQAFLTLKQNMNPVMYKIGKNALEETRFSMNEYVNEIIDERGGEMAGQVVDKFYIECLDKPVNEIIQIIENHVPNLKEIIWEKYVHLIEEKAASFLHTLNISEIIEKKILDYDLSELEEMIMEISKKELNALVWLGGLLGMLMGFVNLLW